MKFTLALTLAAISPHLSFGFDKGFDKVEVRDMISLCNSYTFLEIFGNDEAIIPEGYEKRFSSTTYDLDNKFQVYTKDDFAVISLRGSTDKKPSWLENLYASMIPTQGIIEIKNIKYPYDLEMRNNAAVHGGYVLGATYIMLDLLEQIQILNAEGIHDIFLTGHSQGGALAQVLKLYLESISGTDISEKNKFKTYSFASPKVGNREFTEAYAERYSDGSSFCIVNPKDIVPTLPLTYSDSAFFTRTDLINMMFHRGEHRFKDRIGDGTVRIFTKPLQRSTHIVGERALGQIKKGYSDVKMPAEVNDINYQAAKDQIHILPAEYPKNLADSTVLEDGYFMSIADVDKQGNLKDDDLYQKEPFFYQHKPYNYYVTIMKMYFPEEYEDLAMKFIPENL